MTPATLEHDVEFALSTAAARHQVRDTVRAALEGGSSKDEVYQLLDSIRLRLRENGQEREEEIVMDVMDLFHGAAHSSLLI